MDIDRLIITWHIKASEQGDYFSKFVFEYLAFIAFLRKKKEELRYQQGLRDRDVIQKFKRLEDTKVGYLRRIKDSEELQKAWESIKNEFDGKPFSDAGARSFRKNEHAYWEGEKKGVIHSVEDWKNMVEFWHCVRNNLFHGEKDPECQRDEFAVKFGYKTLRELVELLLEKAEQ
jgi:hypothetical protein